MGNLYMDHRKVLLPHICISLSQWVFENSSKASKANLSYIETTGLKGRLFLLKHVAYGVLICKIRNKGAII